MAEVGGSVIWRLDVDDSGLKAGLNDARSAVASAAKGIDKQTQSLGRIVGGGLSKVGAIAAGALKAGVFAAGAQLTALGAFGLKTGADLQKTRISLQALTGSAKDADKIFGELYQLALKSPFAFPDIAAAGKSLLALGVSAKDVVADMEKLANVSAGTGVEIGTLAGIFGRVTGQGHALGEDLKQLSDNGVAILPALQKQLGLTAEQVMKMASEGKLSVAEFNKALFGLVSPETLALFNNTMPRAIDKLMGSLRNLALTFVGIDISNGFKTATNGLNQAAIDLVSQVAKSLRDPALVQSISGLGAQLAAALPQIGSLIVPLLGAINALAGPLISLISVSIGGLVTLLQAALPGLTIFFTALGGAINSLAPTFQQLGAILGEALGGVLGRFASVLPVLGEALAIILPPLAQIVSLLAVGLARALASIAPAIPPLAVALAAVANVISTVLAAALPVVMPLLRSLAIAFVTIITALVPVIEILGKFAVDLLQQVILPILPQIVEVIKLLAGAFVSVIQAILPILPSLTQLVVQILQQVLLPIMPQIVQLLTLLAGVFVQLVQALIPLMPPIIELASTLITALVPVLPLLVDLFIQLLIAFLPLIPALVKLAIVLLPPFIALLTLLVKVGGLLISAVLIGLAGVIEGIIVAFKAWVLAGVAVIDFFTLLYSKIAGAVTKILLAVSQKIDGVVRLFAQMPGRIVSDIGDMGSILFKKGQQLVQGLLNGAGSMLSQLGKFFIEKLPAFIRDPFKRALGISSPSTVFAGYGKNLMEGLVQGIEGSKGLVDATLGGIGDMTVSPIATVDTSRGQSGSSQQVNVYVNQNGILARSRSDLRDIGKDMIEAVNEELRARRVPELGGGSLSGVTNVG